MTWTPPWKPESIGPAKARVADALVDSYRPGSMRPAYAHPRHNFDFADGLRLVLVAGPCVCGECDGGAEMLHVFARLNLEALPDFDRTLLDTRMKTEDGQVAACMSLRDRLLSRIKALLGTDAKPRGVAVEATMATCSFPHEVLASIRGDDGPPLHVRDVGV